MRVTSLILVTTIASPVFAQASNEGFDGGLNPDSYEIWFDVYNSLPLTGGNPGGYLQLDNVTTGPATCQFLEVFPTAPAMALNSWDTQHSGDYRAAGITEVGIDINVLQGPPGGDIEVMLGQDPGTPGDRTDDCVLILTTGQTAPGSSGWRSYRFSVPTGSTTLPPGWAADGPCVSTQTGDMIWNQVIEDVDYIRFRWDTNPNSFCTFTSWIACVDNIFVGGAPLGTNYCMAAPNCSGGTASIAANGSAAVADNNFTLEVAGVCPNAFSYFIASLTQGFVMNPGGSAGNLCLGGTIGRFDNQVFNVGANGMGSLSVDLTMIPQPSGGPIAVMPGETWNWQCWSRDVDAMGNATSNFSDGLSITFQ